MEAIADLGFAFGGGQALHAHGFGDRLSLDLDFYVIHELLSRRTWTPARLFIDLRDKLRPTITVDEFAADLAAAGNQDPEDYYAYGLTDDDTTRLTADFTRWAAELRTKDSANPGK